MTPCRGAVSFCEREIGVLHAGHRHGMARQAFYQVIHSGFVTGGGADGFGTLHMR
jgi:hypothetical protein